MTMITPSYLGETIEYSSLHACRSTLEDPTEDISGALKRLIGGGRGGMGSMFKVLAVSEPRLTSLAGFQGEQQAVGAAQP